MTSKINPFEDRSKPWIVINGPILPPMPATTSILAFGILGGVLLFTPMIALLGKYIPPEYQESVTQNLALMRDAMLLVLGYYFSKVVNSGEQAMAMKAIQAARESGPQATIPADAQEAADAVADAAVEQAQDYERNR